MIETCSTTPLEEINKYNSPLNMNNSDPSESSTGESQYKEEINEVKNDNNINKYNKNRNKKNGELKLLNKKVKRFNFKSPNKKLKNNNSNKNNNIVNNIFDEFKSSFSDYSKFPQFKLIEKNLRNGIFHSPFDFAKEIRNIFSKLFLSSLTNKDSTKYEKILIISQIFENLFLKYEKNSQIKMAQKLSDDVAKLKKEISKLTRNKNLKNGDLGHVQNLEEKKEKSMEGIREDIKNKISRLNSEQKKGILNILSENYVNKDCGNKMIEFNIYNLPIFQLKQLNNYINKCLNNNININNYIKEVQETEYIIQKDELSDSISELSFSDDSYDFE